MPLIEHNCSTEASFNEGNAGFLAAALAAGAVVVFLLVFLALTGAGSSGVNTN